MKADELIKNVRNWCDEKGLTDPMVQFAKMNEESGEIAHELTRNHLQTPEMKDALGDTFVTLISLSNSLGLDIVECLAVAWEEIKDRKGKTVNGSFVKDE